MKRIALIICIIAICLSLIGCTDPSSNSSTISVGSKETNTSSVVTEQQISSTKEESKNNVSSSIVESEENSPKIETSSKDNASSKKSSTSSKKTTSKTPTHKHSYKKKVIKATCEKEGYTKYTCSCGYSYKADKTDMLGHLYLNWEVVKEATTKKKGLKECKCEKCGVSSITEEIPKKKLHKNVDSRVEIGNMKLSKDPCYRYGKCLIVDKRSWGEVPEIEVTEEGGLRCTYYTKKGKKKVFAFLQPPSDDTTWMYTILENGKYTDVCIGAFK